MILSLPTELRKWADWHRKNRSEGTKGILSAASILFGIIFGYIICAILPFFLETTYMVNGETFPERVKGDPYDRRRETAGNKSFRPFFHAFQPPRIKKQKNT
jgi:hypothetical protein